MQKKMFRVLTPIERDGKTYWVRTGVGFTNKDDSINIHLDVLPTNGRLQLRDFEEDDRRDGANAGANPGANGGRRSSFPPNSVVPATKTDNLPF